ncbi:hypothetical protein HYC85_031816 [Camellia sinensis]|uniref:RBR-type E3 ubiquitin transferase n=1 Tax=Camellia sinensis TaxID=4442 RepID=A0A7J7FRH9_CAMSI|nr:hypothetical protein HYC85_031816 [Camellia sinensis]
MAVESDLDLAFQLQIQEAMNASLAPQPCSSSSSCLASFLDEEIARFEQEHGDHDHAEAEMRRIRDDLSRRIHDQAFARDMSLISEEEWVNTGDHFVRPYGEGSSSSSSVGVSNAEAFRLYFKGLVREERVGGGVKKMSAGIGIAICDLGDYPIFELRKPLFGCDEMSHQVAEVKALIEGLNAAISLGIKRITIICDDNSVYQYVSLPRSGSLEVDCWCSCDIVELLHQLVISLFPRFWLVTGKAMPMQGNLAAFLGQVTLLQRKFSYCSPSLVAQKDIKFALKLASEAIVSQVTCSAESSPVKNMKETCSICLEDTDVCQMFSVNDCLHRYCSSCLKKHVEVKLLQGMLPKCPHDACKTELKIESCRNFLTSELYDLMSQRIKEYSIPATQKIYCPYPRCSALMSKAEALVNTNNAGASMCERCRGLFCMRCKAPWHSNVSCNDYKILNPYPCAEDAKLNSLARRNLWRQCVKCNHMVELAEGCNHIYCRCGYEFCYICGAEWKNKKATCRCPLWDERNIVYDQQNRHQQRLG